MKSILYALLIILTPAILYAEEAGPAQADKFVASYQSRYSNTQSPLTDEQISVLQTVHPLLLPVASDRMYRDIFWFTVRGEKRDIAWDIAAQMIRRGEIRQVSQNHDLSISLLTYDGVLLISKAPNISESYKVIGEVDPHHVFILYSTE